MISIFFRCKREATNSIETVFGSIDGLLKIHNVVSLPYSGASFAKIIKNIVYAWRHRGMVNHITGDAHYIALALGRNTILTVHDVQSALRISNPLKRLYIKLLWFYLPALIVKKITVISDFTRKELEHVIPFAKNKITVIHNPFSPSIQYSARDTTSGLPIILHLGTKENKNLERVAQAASGLRCKLVVLGKMTEKQRLLMEEYKICYEDYYDLPYSKVAKLYKECDIVSFPSLYEGFGMPILEANAAGRPVLAGDIAVLHEVAGEAAYFVNPTDVAAIRNGITELLNNRDLRANLVAKGRENVKRFSPETIADKYNQLYESLLK